jgi:hypothetical protein
MKLVLVCQFQQTKKFMVHYQCGPDFAHSSKELWTTQCDALFHIFFFAAAAKEGMHSSILMIKPNIFPS